MKTTFLKFFSLLFIYVFIFTSCGNDDVKPDTGISPTITLIAGDQFEGVSMLPGSKFTMTFRGEKGSVNMHRIRIEENETLVAKNRLLFDAEEKDNPFLLVNQEEELFSKEITFTANTVPGNYDIVVTIQDGATPAKTAEYAFEYTVSQPDLNEIQGILYNAASSVNTGGLNLQTGNSTGAGNSSAHIKDMGTDGGPVASNWIQKIAPVINNGVSVRILSSEINYSEIQFSSQIKELYANGTEVSSSGTNEKTKVGDTFVARKGENYYLFTIRKVNITTLSDEDNFEIAIKR